MQLMFVLLGVSAAIELLVVFVLQGWAKKVAAALTLILAALASGGLVNVHPKVVSVVVLIFTLYRVINMLRIVEPRMSEVRLERTSRVTSVWLLGLQALVLLAWYAVGQLNVDAAVWLASLVILQFGAACLILDSVLRNMRTTKLRLSSTAIADKDLPTVTIAVPARNEDEAMEPCLQSILASDYPKLEVIVLDDCSQDHTSQVIRTFAHDGVRFVKGAEPKPNWLAKNQAYERLAKEASGDILLFCGVDVRFSPGTVRQLVTAMIQKRKTMMSVAPLNMQRELSLVQATRYLWELAPPRRSFNRPPVLSTCWMITSDELKKAGSFKAVAQAITPEAHFAKVSIKHDGYSFMRADSELGLTSIKSSREQFATALRTRYPQVHRRLELVALLGLFETVFLVAPFVLAVVGAWGVFGFAAEVSLLISCALLVVAQSKLSSLFPQTQWRLSLVFPVAILLDVALLNFSMWKYEFSEVLWKGRNVCIPVMQVVPHLPFANSARKH